MLNNRLFNKTFKIIIFLSIIYFPIFLHLEASAIRQWDESRLAINAFEMWQNGNFLVTHFCGEPEMWGTKPPFLIWLQTFFMTILGPSVLAIRLPSAFAGLFTCIAMLFFFDRIFKKFWLGFISVLILVTTNVYIGYHAVRTGDYDALLTLFTTIYILSFFTSLELKDTKRKNQCLLFFFLALTLAVFTKGVAGLLFIPGLFIYTIIKKHLKWIISNKYFYIGIGVFLLVIIGYYLLREASNPGYLNAVYNNELGGRYMETTEGHKHSFWFFYESLINKRFTLWYLFVPIGLLIGFVHKDKNIKNFAILLALSIISYLLVISSAQTKIELYVIVLFLLLSIFVGIAFFLAFDFIKNFSPLYEKTGVKLFPYIFLFLIFISPYRQIIHKVYSTPNEYPWHEFYQIGYFFKKAIKDKTDLSDYYFIEEGYHPENLFYMNILNEKGIKISYKKKEDLAPNDKVITYQNEINQYIKTHYEWEFLRNDKNVEVIRIKTE